MDRLRANIHVLIIYLDVVGYINLQHHDYKGMTCTMKILHLNAGNETGGGMYHILSLLQQLDREQFVLGVLEKGELMERAEAAGIQTVHFANNIKMSVPLINKLRSYIKQESVNFVHTHGPRANVYANILRRIVHFQWVVTIHSNPLLDFMGKGMYGNFLCKLNVGAIKHADKLIAISEPFRTCLQDAGVSDNKIITALNGIDFHKNTRKAYAKTDFGFAVDDFVFLMVARLERVKGHQVAFEAFARLMSRYPHCQLMLLGDGTLKGELLQLADELGIGEHVHFMGQRDDVDGFYQMADITLLTSHSESFPLVLLESARAKTPVIATDVGGVSELILNQSVGWKVSPGHVQEIVTAMEDALLLYKRGMLSLVGKKLQAHASIKFTVENFAENVYNVYLGMKDNTGM
jgi:glycosyltransferase involved in cell wall biosynthesis